MRRFNVESAYLCGLLHGIGRPVVLQTLVALSKEQGSTLNKEVGASTPGRIITSRSDFWLQTIGVCRRRSWSLSGFMWTTNMPKLPKQECMTTCLAGRLAKHFLDPDSMDEATVREHVIFADLNLYPKDVDALLAHKDKVRAVVEAMPL